MSVHEQQNITDKIEILKILPNCAVLCSFQEITITQDLMFILLVYKIRCLCA